MLRPKHSLHHVGSRIKYHRGLLGSTLPQKAKTKELQHSSFFCRQRSAMDVLARCSIKDAAKCVKCHDLQIPAS